jgi:hypothetical protein
LIQTTIDVLGKLLQLRFGYDPFTCGHVISLISLRI